MIHAHHPHYVGAAARWVADRLGLPMVYELRCFNGDYDLNPDSAYSRLRRRYMNRWEHRVAAAADAVVTISDGLAQRIIAGGADPDRRPHRPQQRQHRHV